MKCSFYADVSCMLNFTDEQWALIINAFKHHYDGGLRGDFSVGGWLYGLNNRRTWSDDKENEELQFTFRQVDKIIKSLELDRSELANELDKRLHKVITMLRSAYDAANSVLKPLSIDNV